jgi:uncharacterized membrane protein
MVSEESSLPITIQNSADYSINVRLTTVSSSPKLDIEPKDEVQKITLEPNTEQKVIVHLKSRANGDTSLSLVLTSDNGKVIAKEKVDIHIFATVGLFLKICFFIIVALAFVLGSYRTYRKHRVNKQDQPVELKS